MINRRLDFPILNRLINGKKLIYFDSAATSLKPEVVINSIVSFYSEYSANVHRGIYWVSEKSTQEYEDVRIKVGKLLNVSSDEIIFVKNTTEAVNLVVKTWGERNIKRGSKIVSSIMEHHSNLVPWMEIAKKKRAKIVLLDINNSGQLKLASKEQILRDASLVAVTHVSNVLGTINPIEKIVKHAHQAGALVLVDGAQAVPHMKVDVSKLGCDFYVFSGHKMLSPFGVGVLWMRKSIAQTLPPFLFGGGIVSKVTLNEVFYQDSPWKFEAGTPNVEGVIGLGAAVDYLNNIGIEKIREEEEILTDYALKKLIKIKDLTIYGPLQAKERGGIIAFNISGIHPHDLATFLDKEGIAIRAGHHCAMPLHHRLGIRSSARISFYIYNSRQEIDKLILALKKIKRVLK